MSLEENIQKYAWPNGTTIHPMMDCFNSSGTGGNMTSVTGCTNPPTLAPDEFGGDDGVGATLTVETYISIIFLLVFGVIGLVGNGTLVCIIALNREMRIVPNVLIASIALGDFLLLLVSVPFTIISYFHSYFIFSEAICKLTSMLPIMSEAVSAFTLAAMAHDRYTAIVKPMSRRKSAAAARIYTVAAALWVLSILLSIPSAILSYKHSFGPKQVYCFYVPHYTTWAKVHETVRCIIMFILPLAIITVYYVIIAKKLLESSLSMPGEGASDSAPAATKQVRARRRLARTVLVLAVLFGVCWMPHFIYRLWFQYNMDEDVFMSTGMLVFQMLSSLLTYLNSCINPVALCFLSKTYRKYYLKYLCCRHGGIFKAGINKTTYSLHPRSVDSKRAIEDSFRNSSVDTKTCTV